MKLELVSFDLCPFVQRSVITLKHKKAPFDIKYIDLENPPEWFKKISPLGQVPVLIVDGKTPIFESAVINEYIDETVGSPLHPRDPLKKAFERAWIEYGSNLLRTQYLLFSETEEADIKPIRDELFEDLLRLESIVDKDGPYFRGAEFGLVDAAYAPLFMRLMLSPEIADDYRWSRMPKVQDWAEALLEVPAVQESVVPDFAEKFVGYCKEVGSPLF